MTDPDPRPVAAAATDPAQPVTIADIAAFTTRHARLRPPALGGDPAEYTALLAHKAKLLARIADQHARTDPAHAGETREITERAQRAVTARHTADAHDTTNVKDLQSPSSPGWGISLSNTGEFRRASSPSVGHDGPAAHDHRAPVGRRRYRRSRGIRHHGCKSHRLRAAQDRRTTRQRGVHDRHVEPESRHRTRRRREVDRGIPYRRGTDRYLGIHLCAQVWRPRRRL